MYNSYSWLSTSMVVHILCHSGVDLIRQGWTRRGPNVLQEGYGSAAVLPEQGIYLAASIYRPVIQVGEMNVIYQLLDDLCL